MATDHTIDRAAIAGDLERARTEFHQLLAEASVTTLDEADPRDTLDQRTVLFHMVFGYMIVQRLLILVKCSGACPIESAASSPAFSTPQPDHSTSSTTTAPARPPRVYNRRRMGAKMDRVIAALQRKLAREPRTRCSRGMHFPTRWDPFFKDYMTLEDVHRYPGQHFDFHIHQLALYSAAD